MLYIANAFSLSMLNRGDQSGEAMSNSWDHCNDFRRTPFPKSLLEVMEIIYIAQQANIEIKSVIGHENTAKDFQDILGIPLEMNRESITLGKKDLIIVGQYVGSRLPEGATELPNGSKYEWWVI